MESKVTSTQNYIDESGHQVPRGYWGNEYSYRDLLSKENLDLVIVETPWEWHAEMCIDTMNAGFHVGTEMPAALTIDECWNLVETSIRTNCHCTLLENVCYFPEVLTLLNMVRKGCFGKIIHSQGGYQHYRIHNHFDEDGNMLWRAHHAIKYNGNLYPTHPLRPIAQWMNINRGDRFDYLTSMSTSSSGINLYTAKKFGNNHPSTKQKYAIGDINTSLIKTVNGKTITLYYDTQLPRPYSLNFRIQGTKGLYMDDMKKIHLDEISPQNRWENITPYEEAYKHPLLKKLPSDIAKFGHFGADYAMMSRLVDDLRKGNNLDIDVFVTATWSSIRPLSIESVANQGRPVKIPDFTMGLWTSAVPVIIRA